VLARVIDAVKTINSPPIYEKILGLEQRYGLTWHGLAPEEMEAAIRSSLDEVRKLTLVRYQSVIEQPRKSAKTTRPAAIVESSHDSDPNEEKPAATDVAQIVAYRGKLLEDYKSATGNPSSKKIYEAGNSGINKPEFYEWKNGQLPDRSRTTQQFEAFLKAKRRLIPKKSTT
jgi:hypothetical protein